MNRKVTKSLGIALVSAAILASSAYAQPLVTPNGPWVQDQQNLSFASFMSNEQLYSKLEQLEKTSQGKMRLEIAGYSNDQNPLYVAKFGDNSPNKKKLLVYTQIHGNEVLGTEAAVELMQKLIAGGKEADEILEKVSVWFMPRINPDGFANTYEGEQYPVRYNHQKWKPEGLGLSADTKAPWYYNAEGKERAQNDDGTIVYGIPGYDLNRDFNPNYDFDVTKVDPALVEQFLNSDQNKGSNVSLVVSPESRALTEVVQNFKPDAIIDVHHRGFNRLSEEDNRSVSVQVLGLFTSEGNVYQDRFDPNTKYQVDPAVLKLSKQMNVVGYEALQRGFSSFGAIQKYPKVNLPGSGLGAFQLNGSATMLIEVKGQTQSLGQKQSGMLKETVKVPIMEILKSLADGSINDVNADLYDQIPDAANRIDPGDRF